MQAGNVVTAEWTGLKVFSATKFEDRREIGGMIERWVRETKPNIVATVVTQSSDSEFHCLSITVFYK